MAGNEWQDPFPPRIDRDMKNKSERERKHKEFAEVHPVFGISSKGVVGVGSILLVF